MTASTPPRPLGLPASYESLAVFRETFLIALPPWQATSLTTLALSLYRRVFESGEGAHDVPVPTPRTYLKAQAADLRFATLLLATCAESFAAEDPERRTRLEAYAASTQDLALRLENEAGSWISLDRGEGKCLGHSFIDQP